MITCYGDIYRRPQTMPGEDPPAPTTPCQNPTDESVWGNTNKSDVENNLLYVKGSIPGAKNAEIVVQKAVKNIQSSIERINSNFFINKLSVILSRKDC